MKTVVYSCPFVPAEWIRSYGLSPSRILPGRDGASPDGGAPAGVCPYAWAFTRVLCLEESAEGIVVTTACDQMRRACEWIRRDGTLPVFLMNVPSTWETVTAWRMYVSELRRLGRFLVRLGGKEPTSDELAAVMRRFDEDRAALRAARGRLSARRYSQAIAAFHREGVLDLECVERAGQARGVGVGVVGGPLLPHDLKLFDLIEQSGGTVVLDGTTSGERTMPAPFDRRAMQDDPFMTLVDAYFGSIPDAFRRPNSLLYQWLEREADRRDVRGIILHYYTWCDTWHAELGRLKEWSRVPVLAIASDAEEQIAGHTASRVEAFVEMLQ